MKILRDGKNVFTALFIRCFLLLVNEGLSDVQMIFLPAGIRYVEADAFNGLSMIGHLKLAHLDVQALDSFVFRGLKHVQVNPTIAVQI